MGVFLLGTGSQALRATHDPVPWRWSNPQPHGGNIFATATRSNLTVQVAERGQIFTSEDLLFWQPRESHTARSLRGVTFFGDRILITGERGLILYADSLFDFRAVDLDTTDWLEGIAASDLLAVAVGDNGAIHTSPDGEAWTHRPVSFFNGLRGVAHGGGVFVAVGEEGLIVTSQDGVEWTRRDSGTDVHLNRVRWVRDRFCVTGDRGHILFGSGDGQTWTKAGAEAVGQLFDVTGNANSRLAVGDHEVWLKQSDGVWTDQILSPAPLRAPAWTYYNATWEGSFYFLSGKTGLMVEGFQTNATSPYVWVNRIRSVRNWLWEMHHSPNFYITVGARGTIMTSSDGIDWQLELPPDTAMDKVLLGVGGTTNVLLAVGEKGTVLLSSNALQNVVFTNTTGDIVTNRVSSLGVKWEQIGEAPTDHDLQGIATWREQFYLSGGNGTILRSADARNWEPLPARTTNFLSSIASFPDGLVAAGQNGILLHSPDGETWSPVNVEAPGWIYRVRYVNGRLFAVGEGGLVMTSPDGREWRRRDAKTNRWLNDVLAMDGTYYVVGNQGTVLASEDLEIWNDLNVSTTKSLFGIAHHHGRLVVAGVEGAILRADIRISPHPLRIRNYDRYEGQNLFLIQGHPGQRFTLDSGSNLVDWTTGPAFEFLDNSGTIIILSPKLKHPSQREFYQAPLLD